MRQKTAVVRNVTHKKYVREKT